MAQNKTWAESQAKDWIKLNFGASDVNKKLAADNIVSTINSQSYPKKDYAARALLELLQNVDDAAAKSFDETKDTAEFILNGNNLRILNQGKTFDEETLRKISLGYISDTANYKKNIATGSKGIGFRGILNWSSDIRIYSSNFAVQFSKEQSLKYIEALKNNEIFQHVKKNAPDVIDKFPIMLLPGNTNFPTEWKDGKYNGFYDTCIEIILDSDAIPRVIDAIKTFLAKEYYSALFFHALKNIKFTYPDANGNTIIKTVRTSNKTENISNHCVKTIEILSNTEHENSQKDFHFFRDGNEMIALPVDWKTWEKKPYTVFCTFPTNAAFCPFPVLMNSYYFEVSSDRERLDVSTINEDIIHKLELMLIETVAPYFAKPEFGTQAIEILTYNKIENTKFLKNIDDLHKLIAKQPIIPTIDGKYKCLTDNLKALMFPNCPEIVLKGNQNDFISPNVHALLAFAPDLQALTPLLDTEALYDIINQKSGNWSTQERVSVFFFWVDVVAELDSNIKDYLMPKLIKNQKGDFFYFNSVEHERIYFHSGEALKALPAWVQFQIVDKQDQSELLARIKSEESDIKSTIDRFFINKYDYIFKHFDKSDVTDRINACINNDYEHAIDLIKFVYHNYKNTDKPRGNEKISWNIPTANRTITSPDKVYFGPDYADTNDAKICRAAELNTMPSPETFGISDDEKEGFIYTIGSFFDIRSDITPKKSIVNYANLPYMYREHIKAKMAEKFEISSIGQIYSVEIEDIPELDTIMKNADQDTLLEWLCTLQLNQTDYMDVEFHKNRSGTRKAILNLNNYTIYQLKNKCWLHLDGDKHSPINCLIKNKKIKYPESAKSLHFVPGDIKYSKLWEMLNIQDNVCHLPQDVFYGFLLELPDIDKDGTVSKKIYHHIATTSNDLLGTLLSTGQSEKKKEFLKTGQVWAKDRKSDRARFYDLSKGVYFSSGKPLNIANKPIMETPPRNGSAADFNHIFGVNEFEENIIANRAASIKHGQNDVFTENFEHFKPYLLALGATQQLDRALPSMEITLVQNIKIMGDTNGLNINFNDYEIVPTEGANKYLVYLDRDATIDTNQIARSIAEICNTISKSGDIRDTIRLLYTSDDQNRKQILLDKGCDISLLTEYKDTKQQFIETVLTICPDADIDMLLNNNPIDFDDFGAYDNAESVVNIITALNTNIEAFENHGFSYINLKQYNKRLLDDYIHANLDKYKTCTYNSLIGCEQAEQEKFMTMVDEFENYAQEHDVPNVHDFDPATFAPNIGTCNEITDIKSIYATNYETLCKTCTDADVLSEILNYESNGSLLIFGHFSALQDKYNAYIQRKASANNTGNSSNNGQANKILEIEQYDTSETLNNASEQAATQSNGKGRRSTQRRHTAQSDNQKQKSGLRAEQRVYDALKDKKFTNINWVSSNAEKAGVLPKGMGDDRKGYDIQYKDQDGKIKYAEVKNATHMSGKKFTFSISPNEEKFARANLHSYSVFLVVNDEKIKQISDKKLEEHLNNAQVETKKCIITLDDEDL